MADYALRVWLEVRGALLAALGITAAWALAALLTRLGAGAWWQASAGLAAFTATVLGVGWLCRMHPADVIEETACALRLTGMFAFGVAAALLILLGAPFHNA